MSAGSAFEYGGKGRKNGVRAVGCPAGADGCRGTADHAGPRGQAQAGTAQEPIPACDVEVEELAKP